MLYKLFFITFLYLELFNNALAIQGYVPKCRRVLRKGNLNEGCELIKVKEDIVINMYKNREKPIYRPFSDACTQCVLCTTIAQEMHIAFYLSHRSFPPRSKLRPKQVNRIITEFCSSAFEKFDLRQRQQMRFLFNPDESTAHVTSPMDGKWAGKLKEMCFMFMDAYGSWYLYEKWHKASHSINFQMSDILCRSESYGVFRYCYNINEDLTPSTITNRFRYIPIRTKP